MKEQLKKILDKLLGIKNNAKVKFEKIVDIVLDRPKPEPKSAPQATAEYISRCARQYEEINPGKKYRDQIPDESGWFVGVIPHDWESRIDQKLAETKAKQDNAGKRIAEILDAKYANNEVKNDVHQLPAEYRKSDDNGPSNTDGMGLPKV